jgi:hypothetical protein
VLALDPHLHCDLGLSLHSRLIAPVSRAQATTWLWGRIAALGPIFTASMPLDGGAEPPETPDGVDFEVIPVAKHRRTPTGATWARSGCLRGLSATQFQTRHPRGFRR